MHRAALTLMVGLMLSLGGGAIAAEWQVSQKKPILNSKFVCLPAVKIKIRGNSDAEIIWRDEPAAKQWVLAAKNAGLDCAVGKKFSRIESRSTENWEKAFNGFGFWAWGNARCGGVPKDCRGHIVSRRSGIVRVGNFNLHGEMRQGVIFREDGTNISVQSGDGRFSSIDGWFMPIAPVIMPNNDIAYLSSHGNSTPIDQSWNQYGSPSFPEWKKDTKFQLNLFMSDGTALQVPLKSKVCSERRTKFPEEKDCIGAIIYKSGIYIGEKSWARLKSNFQQSGSGYQFHDGKRTISGLQGAGSETSNLASISNETQKDKTKNTSKTLDKPSTSTFPAWLRRAKDGNPIYQYNVAMAYHFGEGTKKNIQEAIFWYEKAADQGLQQAQFNLGLLYYNGDEIAINFDRASFWLRQAATGTAEEPAGRSRELLGMIADLRKAESAKNQEQKVSPPVILVTETTVDGPKGTLVGKVTDEGVVAEFSVDGTKVDLDEAGSFNVNTYIPEGGITLTLEAIDFGGLSSSITVRLDRIVPEQPSISFARLNPLSRKVESNNKALALIIGVSNYRELNAPAVFADSDAKVFADYAAEKLGVSRLRIKTLVNDGADEKDILLAAKRWIARGTAAGQSDIYVFFAGHGLASDDGQHMYLMPHDGTPELLEDTAVSTNRLFTDIAAANPRSVTVFLDTCYSGTTRGPDMLIASRPIAIRAKEQAVPEGFTVMTAAAGDQTAKPLEEAKHGMFSYFLMKGMEGDADANQDNQITAGELHAYVQQNVMQQSSGSQTPELQGDRDRVLVRFQ